MTSTPPDTASPVRSASAHASIASGLDGRPCVYYDGGCPLCRAEIAAYQRAPGGESIRWVDAHGCEPAELGPGLERREALARLHVRRADGALVEGAAAFVAIWAALPRWRWLARVARLPGVLPALELGYSGFLRVRPLWRRRGSDGAGTHQA